LALCEELLACLAQPRTRPELSAALGEVAHEFEADAIDELLSMLVEAGVVGPVREPAARPPAGPRPRVVLGVTGAIQAVDAPRLVGLLQAAGMEVRVAATKAARQLVSMDALAAITHHPVATRIWGGPACPATHVELAEWADLVLVYPASATTLSRLACGDFGDVVSAVAMTTRAPVALFPSMNGGMLQAAAVARNLSTLRDDGFFVVDPAVGVEVAAPPAARQPTAGPTLPPERVIDLVQLLLKRASPRGPVAARGSIQ
jgi:phosphopantothenoylcysteine decarboxylase/phosphopantothenate--cysteine ligase